MLVSIISNSSDNSYVVSKKLDKAFDNKFKLQPRQISSPPTNIVDIPFCYRNEEYCNLKRVNHGSHILDSALKFLNVYGDCVANQSQELLPIKFKAILL